MAAITGNSVHISLERKIDESHDIIVDADLWRRVGADIRKMKLGPACVIITDSKVRGLYAKRLENALYSEGIKPGIFSFKAGESRKNVHAWYNLTLNLLQKRYGRDTVIIGLGGGVVTDIAGFIAGTMHRGAPDLLLYPTTLVAQADAAIGGKNGIDTPYGKNQLGTYKQPKAVYNDVNTLKTLGKTDFSCGLPEITKTAVIADVKLFDYLEQNVQKIMQRDVNVLVHIIKQSCKIKGTIVEQDPNEEGPRMKLNYGHTIAHALEVLSNYKMRHGNAVSIGLNVEGRASFEKGSFPFQDWERQENLLSRFGRPTVVPPRFSNKAIIAATYGDKKSLNGTPRYALPAAIGKMCTFGDSFATPVDAATLKKAFYETRF